MKRTMLLVLAVSSVTGFATGLGGSFLGARLTAKAPAPPSLHASLCKSESDPEVRKILCETSEEWVRLLAAMTHMEERGVSSEEIDKFEARAKALLALRK